MVPTFFRNNLSSPRISTMATLIREQFLEKKVVSMLIKHSISLKLKKSFLPQPQRSND